MDKQDKVKHGVYENGVILGGNNVGISDLHYGNFHGIGFFNLDEPVENAGDNCSDQVSKDIRSQKIVVISDSIKSLKVLRDAVDRAIKVAKEKADG